MNFFSSYDEGTVSYSGCGIDDSGDDDDEDDLLSINSWTGSSDSSKPDDFASFSPPLVSLEDGEWVYRGEGGANLVVSVPAERVVVRFSKSKYADVKDKHDSKVKAIAHYANRVVRPALGEQFVRPLGIGTVSLEQIQRVKTALNRGVRPPSRCNKDIAGRTVVISADCVHLTQHHDVDTEGDTFCVEIKPNQGWLAVDDSTGRTLDVCHRCLKQFTKTWLSEGGGGLCHGYCPLDLFSGNLARMKKAIFALLWNPENRFKIFKNGDLMYADARGCLDVVKDEFQSWLGEQEAINRLVTLICAGLLAPVGAVEGCSRNFPVDDKQLDQSPTRFEECFPTSSSRKCCDGTSQLHLPKECILGKLLELQRGTDDLNVQGAKHLCDRLLLDTKISMEELHQVLVWNSATDLTDGNECPSTSSSLCDFKAATLAPPVQPCLSFSSSEFNDIKRLQRYLLSITAKDISLMLTLRKVAKEKTSASAGLPTLILGDTGQSFRMLVSVIDLDPKPVNRIKTWIKRKDEMLKAYSNL